MGQIGLLARLWILQHFLPTVTDLVTIDWFLDRPLALWLVPSLHHVVDVISEHFSFHIFNIPTFCAARFLYTPRSKCRDRIGGKLICGESSLTFYWVSLIYSIRIRQEKRT